MGVQRLPYRLCHIQGFLYFIILNDGALFSKKTKIFSSRRQTFFQETKKISQPWGL